VREVMVKFMYKGWIIPKMIHIYSFFIADKKNNDKSETYFIIIYSK